MRLLFSVSLAFLLAVVLAAPCAAGSLELIHDDGQASFRAKWTQDFEASAHSVPSDYNCFAQWPDGYPGNPTGRTVLGYLGDHVTGTTPNYEGVFTLPAASKTFGQSQLVVSASIWLCDNCGHPPSWPGTNGAIALGNKPPYTTGQFLVQVAGYDTAASGAAGHPVFSKVQGAVLKCFERDLGTPYPSSVTCRQFTKGGKDYTVALFGVNPNGSATDAGFPSGSADSFYKFSCEAPGFKPFTAAMSDQYTGALMPGQAYIITMYPPDRPETPTIAAGTTTPDGLTSANVDAPTGGGNTGGTTGGTTGGGSSGGGTAGGGWFDSFWENFKAKMAELLVPSPAALDALKSKWLRLATWGPFGYPAQLATLWSNAQTGINNGDPARADYWYFYLLPGDGRPVYPLTGPEIGMPKDYNPATAYQMVVPPPPVPMPDLFPHYLDLNPFVGPILYLRALLLISVWFFFLMRLYTYFVPRLKV